jgi:hypothetical protein
MNNAELQILLPLAGRRVMQVPIGQHGQKTASIWGGLACLQQNRPIEELKEPGWMNAIWLWEFVTGFGNWRNERPKPPPTSVGYGPDADLGNHRIR